MKSSLTPATARGFTLIELVVVIVILGILAATALPKFADMSTEARISSLNTMASTLRTTASLVKSKCLVTPECDASLSTEWTSGFQINGVTPKLNYGWPDGGDFLNNGQIDQLVDSTGFAVSLVSGKTRFTIASAPTPAQCYVDYADAFFNSGGPQTYAVTVVSTGC